MKQRFFRKILKNGMIIFLEKRNLPIVSLAYVVRNGSINETLEEKGISHYMEHMLYKGTPTRNSRQIAKEIEGTGGILNGFTSEEVTAFWCKIPNKNLSIGLEVLGDLMKNPLFEKKELEKERQVIFEEIKMYHDTPALYVQDRIQNLLYDGTMGKDIIGSYETMNSITREKIVKKFKEIYTPNNLILAVVGDVDFEGLVKFVEKNFGTERAEVPKISFGTKNDSVIEEREGISQANLVFAHHTPLATDDKSYAAIILNELMVGGMSSRLFSEIREKRNLAYAVRGGSNINERFSYNFVSIGTKKENVEIVKKIILEEYKKVSESLEEKEFSDIKKQLIGNYLLSMEDSQEQLINLIISEYLGNAENFYNFEEKINKVTLEEVKELADIKNYSFFALVPK